MKMLRIAAALIAMVLLTAQTSLPTAAPKLLGQPAKGQVAKTEPRTDQANRAPEQRGTENLPVVVSLKAAAYHQTERAEDKADRAQQAKTEQHLAGYTWYLVVATIALAFIAAVQAVLFLIGLKDTTVAARASATQAETSRHQYIASNRPRLRVRLIRVDTPVPGQQIVVRYEVVNVGGTKATIIDTYLTIRIDLPNAAVLHGVRTRGVTETRSIGFYRELRQGEALPAEGRLLQYDPNAWGFGDGPWWEGRLFIIGIIRYADDNGVTRRTAFYRMATRDLNRFIMPLTEPTAIADHDYED